MLPNRKEMRPVQQAGSRPVVSGAYGGGSVEKARSERFEAVEEWEKRAAAAGIEWWDGQLSTGYWHPGLKRGGIFIFKFDFFTAVDELRKC